MAATDRSLFDLPDTRPPLARHTPGMVEAPTVLPARHPGPSARVQDPFPGTARSRRPRNRHRQNGYARMPNEEIYTFQYPPEQPPQGPEPGKATP